MTFFLAFRFGWIRVGSETDDSLLDLLLFLILSTNDVVLCCVTGVEVDGVSTFAGRNGEDETSGDTTVTGVDGDVSSVC